MMLDRLQRARAQCIAYYVCNGDELGQIQKGNYQKRSESLFSEYRECCKRFADKVCDSMAHYENLDDHERTMLMDSYTQSLDKIITSLELVYCELGMHIGFTMALDLGLQGYKEKRGVAYE